MIEALDGKKCVEFSPVLLMMRPVMSRHAHSVTPVRPGSRVWWARLVVAVVLMVWFNAVAWHTFTEPHAGGLGHHHSNPGGECARGQLHSHETDCHPPHMANDYGYLPSIRTAGPVLPQFALTDASGCAPPDLPAANRSSPLEESRRPGADPPAPAQPRAPPFV